MLGDPLPPSAGRARLLQTPVHREDSPVCPGQSHDRVSGLALRCWTRADGHDLGAVPSGQHSKAWPGSACRGADSEGEVGCLVI